VVPLFRGLSYGDFEIILGSLKMKRRKMGVNAFQLLDLEAKKVPPGSEGLLVLPYFMGERAPLWNPKARGAILGLTLYHTKAHLYRALMEAAAYSLRHSIETGLECGLKIKEETRLVGGVAKSRLWVQILADVIGRPILIPGGNAEALPIFLQGLGPGTSSVQQSPCHDAKGV